STRSRYVNHSKQAPNLELVAMPVKGGETGTTEVGMATIRHVREGEELTFDYGDRYFEEVEEGDVIEDGLDMQDLLSGVDWGGSGLSF
ncbi:unnamed protein product, partial [Choristocarpus tenellus]